MQKKKPALDLPDALLVRYYRQGELDHVAKVCAHKDGRLEVQLRFRLEQNNRSDFWRDLGGGIGIVPDAN